VASDYHLKISVSKPSVQHMTDNDNEKSQFNSHYCGAQSRSPQLGYLNGRLH